MGIKGINRPGSDKVGKRASGARRHGLSFVGTDWCKKWEKKEEEKKKKKREKRKKEEGEKRKREREN